MNSRKCEICGEPFYINRAREAVQAIDEMRRKGVFDNGKTGVEIIREWRDKRARQILGSPD